MLRLTNLAVRDSFRILKTAILVPTCSLKSCLVSMSAMQYLGYNLIHSVPDSLQMSFNHHARTAQCFELHLALRQSADAETNTRTWSLAPVLSGPSGRAKLNEWLFTLPDPVLGAGIILPLLLRNQKAKTALNRSGVIVPNADTKIRWALFSGHASIGYR
jgi:hypothetical protein